MAYKPGVKSVLSSKQDANYHNVLQQRKTIVENNAREQKNSQPGWITPSSSSIKKYELGTPNQQKLNDTAAQKGQQILQNYNTQPRNWETYAQLARQANQRSQRSLAERFHGLQGNGGGLGSQTSAFQGLSENNANFEAQLAAAKAEFDLMNDNNQLSQFSTLAGQANQPQYGYEHIPGQPSHLGRAWNKAAGPLIGAGLGWAGGGPLGAVAGGIGGYLNSLRSPENINKYKGTPLYDNYETASQQGHAKSVDTGGGASGFTQRNNPYTIGQGNGGQGSYQDTAIGRIMALINSGYLNH